MQSYARVSSAGDQLVVGSNIRILHPMKAGLNYPRMNVTAIRVISSVCVILGIMSIFIQVNSNKFTIISVASY